MSEPNPDLSGRIIGAGTRVHEELGPEFLEIVCEEALCLEFTAIGLRFERQAPVVVNRPDPFCDPSILAKGVELFAGAFAQFYGGNSSNKTSRS